MSVAVSTSWTALQAWVTQEDLYASAKNSQVLAVESETKTLSLFQSVAHQVPAYKDFLIKHKVKPDKIKSFSDFQSVPVTTKENYILAYPTKARCWDGHFNSMHMISSSSGTTGQSVFWPRDVETELAGAQFHEFIFKYLCQIHTKRTLLINGFAMGNWIAGTFTLACSQLVALKGYPLTIMTPGYDTDAVLGVLKDIAPDFDQVILTGHTPFLKEVVEQATEQKIAFAQNRLTLLGTGQSITESWRDYMLSLIQAKDESHILNLYGSADAALMGAETPWTIACRRLLSQDAFLSHQLFHDDRLPSLYAFDPRLTFIEAINHELHITKRTGAPLIRYNLHDTGGVYQPIELQKSIQNKITSKDTFHLPILYLFGREKFMVKIYGANIYTEHVQLAFTQPYLQPYITGRYLLEMAYDSDQNPQLLCRVELNKKISISPHLLEKISDAFITEVRKINSEYNFVLQKMGKKAHPHIMLYTYQDKKYFPVGVMKKQT